MSFISRMQEAARQAETVQRDPWEPRLRRALKDVEAMSTAALLDLVRARATTGNARRLAAIMRELNFIPIKTRRFMPGGLRDTVTRGWARPVRGKLQPLAGCKGETAGWSGHPLPTRAQGDTP